MVFTSFIDHRCCNIFQDYKKERERVRGGGERERGAERNRREREREREEKRPRILGAVSLSDRNRMLADTKFLVKAVR